MRIVFICVLSFLLIGCAGAPVPPLGRVEAVNKTQIEKLKVFSTSLELESQVRISGPTLHEAVNAVIKQSYYSALGQQCYRIVVKGSLKSDLDVLCRDKMGGWNIVPSLQSLSK